MRIGCILLLLVTTCFFAGCGGTTITATDTRIADNGLWDPASTPQKVDDSRISTNEKGETIRIYTDAEGNKKVEVIKPQLH